ncbi:MAG: type II toxin-antitoxin system VapC family toxin [Dermatophilaceae bacterium]
MRVVDAGVVVELLIGGLDPDRLGDEELAAPHLLDSEVVHALRGLVRRGALTATQADVAVRGFARLMLTRFPADGLRTRMWELRHTLSGYDATYVALAEAVNATELLTTDAKLAASVGPTCRIELLR